MTSWGDDDKNRIIFLRRIINSSSERNLSDSELADLRAEFDALNNKLVEQSYSKRNRDADADAGAGAGAGAGVADAVAGAGVADDDDDDDDDADDDVDDDDDADDDDDDDDDADVDDDDDDADDDGAEPVKRPNSSTVSMPISESELPHQTGEELRRWKRTKEAINRLPGVTVIETEDGAVFRLRPAEGEDRIKRAMVGVNDLLKENNTEHRKYRLNPHPRGPRADEFTLEPDKIDPELLRINEELDQIKDVESRSSSYIPLQFTGKRRAMATNTPVYHGTMAPNFGHLRLRSSISPYKEVSDNWQGNLGDKGVPRTMELRLNVPGGVPEVETHDGAYVTLDDYERLAKRAKVPVIALMDPPGRGEVGKNDEFLIFDENAVRIYRHDTDLESDKDFDDKAVVDFYDLPKVASTDVNTARTKTPTENNDGPQQIQQQRQSSIITDVENYKAYQAQKKQPRLRNGDRLLRSGVTKTTTPTLKVKGGQELKAARR